ncbi:uncharacterized protein LOC131940928 isoform X2 [Physella acuta]|uniref:uncharacterized protein LOC131940928 isoform X2 n=1 Tax=Physella acuta TaxID=109671 RepID=UPI0027DE2939|nr:uncharacterized protein LOC131940928 isoform X2 [Physella acuta]
MAYKRTLKTCSVVTNGVLLLMLVVYFNVQAGQAKKVDTTFDLRSMSVEQALTRVRQTLQAFETLSGQSGPVDVTFITGTGKKIQPSVYEQLDKKGYRVKWNMKEGSVVVSIEGNKRIKKDL